MKKFIMILITLTLIISASVTTTFAASSSGSYIKVKKATYMKYKKAAKKTDKLQTKVDNQKKQIKELKEKLEAEKSKNNWVWNNLYSMGITYNSKVWSIPKTIPSKFMINGVFYQAQWE